MRNNRGNIEVLLLLSCLVGVVMFISFSLAYTSLLSTSPGESELRSEQQGLQPEKEDKEAKRIALEEKKKELEKQKRELQNEIREIRMGEELNEEFLEVINRLERELERSRQEHKILGKERDKLKTIILLAGSSQFNNPLFVECKKDSYIMYPQKEIIAVRDLENRNPFKEKAERRHDIIVLFVRPEGIDSFWKAYAKVKAIPSVALSYEPIEADKNLYFLDE